MTGKITSWSRAAAQAGVAGCCHLASPSPVSWSGSGITSRLVRRKRWVASIEAALRTGTPEAEGGDGHSPTLGLRPQGPSATWKLGSSNPQRALGEGQIRSEAAGRMGQTPRGSCPSLPDGDGSMEDCATTDWESEEFHPLTLSPCLGLSYNSYYQSGNQGTEQGRDLPKATQVFKTGSVFSPGEEATCAKALRQDRG